MASPLAFCQQLLLAGFLFPWTVPREWYLESSEHNSSGLRIEGFRVAVGGLATVGLFDVAWLLSKDSSLLHGSSLGCLFWHSAVQIVRIVCASSDCSGCSSEQGSLSFSSFGRELLQRSAGGVDGAVMHANRCSFVSSTGFPTP